MPDYDALDDFSGIGRLFPLPNVVLFPKVMQPLHIFEPRYRQMTRDALGGDRLITMVLLRPGWEGNTNGRPGFFPIGCLGRIMTEQCYADGRFNILLRGLRRVRVQEIPSEKLYRQGRLELLQDTGVPPPTKAKALREELVQMVLPWFSASPENRDQFLELARRDIPESVLCDIYSSALPLTIDARQTLLDELHVEQRLRTLLSYLHVADPGAKVVPVPQAYPPDFSEN
jgi:Lon protease-like protein